MPTTRRSAGDTTLSELEMGAWAGLLRAHSVVTRRLDRELEDESDLSLAQYDVLVNLAAAPGRMLHMTRLSEAVLLSRSGITRLVDRLEALGYVKRQSCPDDARAVHANLTAAGLAALRKAAPVHLRGVREHVTSRLTDAELRQMGTALGRIADAG